MRLTGSDRTGSGSVSKAILNQHVRLYYIPLRISILLIIKFLFNNAERL